MDQKTIKEFIDNLSQMTAFLQSLLDEEYRQIAEPNSEKERLAELTTLRLLSKSDKWPEALPQESICDDSDDDQKLVRAVTILQDLVKSSVSDTKFLDFGCGEGHVAYMASLLTTKKSVGYDIIQPENNFKKNDKCLFTTDWETVKTEGPYDIILANDVLDHTVDILSHPRRLQPILKNMQEVKAPEGKVYLRCHPWTSRHGTHLYKQLNKAYLHLVFTPEELFAMGLKETKTIQVFDPLEYYRKNIQDAGFTVLKEEITTTPVELFFTATPEVLRRIKCRWDGKFPRDIIEIQLVDYTLI